ncbi:MAG: ATP-binding cassette domain-containing protein [Lachnospiraceae bacterium]|nr:ATP-binding cassette domain-containing protein [Lachnospiraceae bacterium]
MDQIVICKDLTKKYGNNKVIDNLSMEVYKGDIYGLIGVNGAGKTTLLKSILSIINVDSGKISLDAEIINNNNIGSMIDAPAFFGELTAEQNLEYYRIMFGRDENISVKALLEIVGLKTNSKISFKKFSMGMKQRLGIALAIMDNPSLVVLDEPLNGLDPLGIVEIRELIIKLNRERGITFMISSHNLPELELTANRFGIMHKGKIRKDISSEQLKEICRNGHKIILEKDIDISSFQYEDILICGNEIICTGNVLLEEVKNEIERKGFKVKSVVEYELSLEDYFRICIMEDEE